MLSAQYCNCQFSISRGFVFFFFHLLEIISRLLNSCIAALILSQITFLCITYISFFFSHFRSYVVAKVPQEANIVTWMWHFDTSNKTKINGIFFEHFNKLWRARVQPCYMRFFFCPTIHSEFSLADVYFLLFFHCKLSPLKLNCDP